jgi:hypothetical protein
LVDHKSGALGPALSSYLREGERPELLRALAEQGTVRGRWELANVWEAIFPLVEPAINDEGYGIILLDSNARSNFSLTNAVGVVNPAQLRTLILHGHRHVDWIGATGDTVLCSAPSVTLGPDKYRGRFTIHEFALGTNGSIQLTANERVKVSSDARQLDDLGGSRPQEAA